MLIGYYQRLKPPFAVQLNNNNNNNNEMLMVFMRRWEIQAYLHGTFLP
jgi:hypothetical protein